MVSTKWLYLQCPARSNPSRAERRTEAQQNQHIVTHFPGAPCIAACSCKAEPTFTSVSEHAARQHHTRGIESDVRRYPFFFGHCDEEIVLVLRQEVLKDRHAGHTRLNTPVAVAGW